MNDICNMPYGTWAKIYRERGLCPRPLKYPGTDSNNKPLGKACKEAGWQKPDSELPEGTIERWENNYSHFNIGLLMGTPVGDGTLIGALDIDHNSYVKLGKALLGGNPPCGRIGKKGAVFFVRFNPFTGKKKFTVKGEQNKEYGQVAELLLEKTLCVIPPSIHPDTKQPYRWLGTPLHEIDLTRLPLIGE